MQRCAIQVVSQSTLKYSHIFAAPCSLEKRLTPLTQNLYLHQLFYKAVPSSCKQGQVTPGAKLGLQGIIILLISPKFKNGLRTLDTLFILRHRIGQLVHAYSQLALHGRKSSPG